MISSNLYENLKVGDHTYDAKIIYGYVLICSSSKIVTLSITATQTIIFEYILFNCTNDNEVPYIYLLYKPNNSS